VPHERLERSRLLLFSVCLGDEEPALNLFTRSKEAGMVH